MACRFGVDSRVVYLLREYRNQSKLWWGGEESRVMSTYQATFELPVRCASRDVKCAVWCMRVDLRREREAGEGNLRVFSVRMVCQATGPDERGAGRVSRGDQEGAASCIGGKWSKYEVTEAAKDSDRGQCR